MFDIPEEFRPETLIVPKPESVVSWVETVERLWDDPDLYALESRKCRDHAAVWNDDVLAEQYMRFFST